MRRDQRAVWAIIGWILMLLLLATSLIVGVYAMARIERISMEHQQIGGVLSNICLAMGLSCDTLHRP
jgi:Flp pilus assembly protein TadB